MLNIDVQLDRGRFQLTAQFSLRHRVTGLFGPSGSGKSTLLHLIAGLVQPHRGRMEIAGTTVFDTDRRLFLPPHKRRVGLVFQDSQLFPHRSVQGNLLYGYHRTAKQLRRFQPDEIIQLLDIGHLLNAVPSQLSGGEKQRVALGRSLLASPCLLLLDEPLAALDQGLKDQILPFLRRVKDELDLPMIYVSHALGEILSLTDELIVMSGGRIVGAGPWQQLLNKDQVRGVTGSHALDNVLPVTILAHEPAAGCTLARYFGVRLQLPLNAALPSGSECLVSIRSSEIALSRAPLSGTSIQNQIKGRICALILHQTTLLVQIDAGATLLAEITPRAGTELGLSEGDFVYCLIKTQSLEYAADRPDAPAKQHHLTVYENRGFTATTNPSPKAFDVKV